MNDYYIGLLNATQAY